SLGFSLGCFLRIPLGLGRFPLLRLLLRPSGGLLALMLQQLGLRLLGLLRQALGLCLLAALLLLLRGLHCVLRPLSGFPLLRLVLLGLGRRRGCLLAGVLPEQTGHLGLYFRLLHPDRTALQEQGLARILHAGQ